MKFFSVPSNEKQHKKQSNHNITTTKPNQTKLLTLQRIMTIRYILLVNKQGQTRLSKYYEYSNLDKRTALEGEIVRKCLSRNESQCSFLGESSFLLLLLLLLLLLFLEMRLDERWEIR